MHCQIYCGYFLLVSDLPSICVNLLMTNVFNVDVQLLLCSKNLCLFQGHKHFIMFFSRTFRVSDFIFNSMIHLKSVLHMVWGKNRFFFFFFSYMNIQLFSTFDRKTILSPTELLWHLCQTSIDCINVSPFWSLYFILFIVMLTSYQLNYCILVSLYMR